MTFARYMELALYDPDFGYYRSDDRFGIHGDFHTAEQLQPVFGELVASFVEKLTDDNRLAQPIGVLEIGAGRGEMRQALAPHGYRAFDWKTPELPGSWRGLTLANEFFDALPVHLMVRADGWKELFVVEEGGELKFETAQPSQPALAIYADRFGGKLPEGSRLEVCLAAANWMKRIAEITDAGWLLVIDYGYDDRELLRFPEGTLLSYRRHTAQPVVLNEPGCSDITSHVNFSWLAEAAESNALKCETSSRLADWALTVWDEETLAKRWARGNLRWRLQWKQLLFGMGQTFHVLLFRKAGGK